MVADAIARSNSPHDIFKYRDMGSVSVFNLIAPATISAAPNSPIALDHVITAPARSPFFDIGSVTLQNACEGVQPRVSAICSYLGFILSKVDLSILNIKGIFTKN